jgi:hypothetical protein
MKKIKLNHYLLGLMQNSYYEDGPNSYLAKVTGRTGFSMKEGKHLTISCRCPNTNTIRFVGVDIDELIDTGESDAEVFDKISQGVACINSENIEKLKSLGAEVVEDE